MDVSWAHDRGDDPEPEPEPGSNVLVLVPTESLDAEWYLEWVDPESIASNVLLVSSRCSAEALVDAWQSRIGPLPDALAIISLGERARSPSKHPTTVERNGIPVTTAAPDDLTGIGTRVTSHLDRWADDLPATVWFDSVDDVVDAVGLETTFRFLHLLTGRVRRSGAVAYYQLDPSVNERRTVSALTPLFDTVLE